MLITRTCWPRAWLSLALAGVMAVMTTCAPGRTPETSAPSTRTPSTIGPGRSPGPELTVVGTVMRVIDLHVFELRQDGEGPLLVLSPEPRQIRVGAVIQATGRVRTLRTIALEIEFGLDLDDVRLAGREGDDILVGIVTEAP